MSPTYLPTCRSVSLRLCFSRQKQERNSHPFHLYFLQQEILMNAPQSGSISSSFLGPHYDEFDHVIRVSEERREKEEELRNKHDYRQERGMVKREITKDRIEIWSEARHQMGRGTNT